MYNCIFSNYKPCTSKHPCKNTWGLTLVWGVSLFLTLSCAFFLSFVILPVLTPWFFLNPCLVSTVISRSFLHHHHDLQVSPNWSPYFRASMKISVKLCVHLLPGLSYVCVRVHIWEISIVQIYENLCINSIIPLKENALPFGTLRAWRFESLPSYCWLPTELIMELGASDFNLAFTCSEGCRMSEHPVCDLSWRLSSWFWDSLKRG